MRLFLDGVLVSGPVRKGEHLLVDARGLPDAPGVAKGEAGHDEALAILAARYAWGHGPVDAADLARWAGLTLTEARRSLAGAARIGGSAGYPLVERRGLLARADIEALLERNRDEADGVFALPSFDELHVGYRDRSCLTDRAGEALICPAANGMFRPIVVARGRVAAVRSPGGDLLFAEEGTAWVHEAAREMRRWDDWLSEKQR